MEYLGVLFLLIYQVQLVRIKAQPPYIDHNIAQLKLTYNEKPLRPLPTIDKVGVYKGGAILGFPNSIYQPSLGKRGKSYRQPFFLKVEYINNIDTTRQGIPNTDGPLYPYIYSFPV